MVEHSRKRKGQSNAGKPISLKPLKFDEALSDLLKVKPVVKKPKSAVGEDNASDEVKSDV